MRTARLSDATQWFEVLLTGAHTQAAVMRLDRGAESGEGLNTHAADQLLLVLEGAVHGQVGEEEVDLGPGELVLVPAGTPHRFENRGRTSAVTFNVYGPPAY